MSPALAIPFAVLALPVGFGLFIGGIVLLDELSDYVLVLGVAAAVVGFVGMMASFLIDGLNGDVPAWVIATLLGGLGCATAGAAAAE